jgi:nucleolar protein 12
VEEVEDEEDNSDLENAYLGVQPELAHKPDAPHDSEDIEEAFDEEPHPPVHESLQKDKKHNRAAAKTKFVPADETAERRDQRTIFVGNLSVEVAQKRVSPKVTLLFQLDPNMYDTSSSAASQTAPAPHPKSDPYC